MKMKDWRSSTEKDGKDPNESSDAEGKEGEKNEETLLRLHSQFFATKRHQQRGEEEHVGGLSGVHPGGLRRWELH